MQTNTQDCVVTEQLSKSYGGVRSLINCSIRVPEGCVFGLLGPNGAGKSTFIRTLLGFLKPTSGRATVCGFDSEHQSIDVRRQVSYLPGDARLYRTYRGKHILQLFAELHPMGSLRCSLEIAKRLNLDLSRRVAFMSTGMRQKLAIAVVLGCRTPLLILDEPTANLDPDVRREVLEIVCESRNRGQTVLLSSHVFSDIDKSCDRVGILRGGKVVAVHRIEADSKTHVARMAVAGEISRYDLDAISMQSFVSHVDLNSVQATRRLAIHLEGNADNWISWLSKLVDEHGGLGELTIEKTGIQAVYDQVVCNGMLPAKSESTETPS